MEMDGFASPAGENMLHFATCVSQTEEMLGSSKDDRTT
jgi:hypothetical protein